MKLSTAIQILKDAGIADSTREARYLFSHFSSLPAHCFYGTDPDIDEPPLTKAISEKVKIPVIASGGGGKKEHFYEALTEGGASAALAATLFHYRELSVKEVKDFLSEKGVSVRL